MPTIALLVLALCALVAPNSGAADTPERATPPGLQRLGDCPEASVFRRIARPRLDSETGDLDLAIPDLRAGTLLLAAGVIESRDALGLESVQCRAALRGRDGSVQKLVEFDVPVVEDDRGPEWRTATAPVPAAANAVLELRCAPPAGTAAESVPTVSWAQPLVIPPAAATPQPLVVLMSLDTLRADHVTGFGDTAGLTPNLLRLGDEGLRITRATSDDTWTRPSHLALFESGYRKNGSESGGAVPLPRVFADAGFATIGITGGGYVSANFGFHKGFDYYWMPLDRKEGRPTFASMLDDATRWIERVGNSPMFLFVHTYAVHKSSPEQVAWQKKYGKGRRYDPKADELERSASFYRDLVVELDETLGPFFAKLRVLAAERPVTLVLTSDHGEGFKEHGFFGHGGKLPPHVELDHIPMIVWSTQGIGGGKHDEEPTMLADLAPTLLTAAGLETPPTMRGRDLWPRWTALSQSAPAPPLADATRGSVTRNARNWALHHGDYKLIVLRVGQDTPGESALRYGLFDTRADPAERKNLAAERPDLVNAMNDRLYERLESLGVGPRELRSFRNESNEAGGDEGQVPQPGSEAEGEIDDLTREQLEALGYLE